MDKDINKIQEDIVKADIRKADKMWKDMDENSSLDYHLDRMTKEELVKVASKYNIRGITSLKKADAVLKVKEGIINNIDLVLNLLDEEGIEYIEEMVSLNGRKNYKCSELIDANYFRNRGLMFTGMVDKKLNVILPNELIDILKDKLTTDLKKKAKNNTEIIKLFAGMVYFYGVLTFENFKELVKSYIDFEIKDMNIESLILNGEELGFDYQVEGNLAYHIDVEEPLLIIKEQESNEDINYLKIDKKTIIKASRPDFIEESKQGEKLEKVMGQLFVIDKKILKEEIDSFSIAIKNEVSLDEAVEVFLEAYEIESEEERIIFTGELEKLAKSIKRWTLKGHTENDIQNKKKTVVNEVRIGRNDPCPCGSNKKYKKCCGK
ncbi:SEC-C metal-binding domain-containing protein [Clostridium septicum]|uniref:SEC-C metal-binding domain-containing protein n=1 Tax=Clostridium septicum TaxID=1504 RepID=A0A9N7JIF7_CLOSE|nr:SEC-C metal-binding domain-containing protein [Clostridium septicum]AYE33193.1 hypothetical protein CP523_01325 [Clostridium septicum]MDU1315110.1 SEC-C metal-binding domain-containing protein [Clostridium septicum]QAS61363.1 hypothetical protein EI377_11825 [Clostridium septicum]UEC22205.1 SEC-C domain-containing protein [Clostridium septicum]USR99766.1 SEC-C metal-binding domain-containing protein [Clostridium septicum]